MWGWKLDLLCKKCNQPARHSLDIIVPRSGEDENHPEIWGQDPMSQTVSGWLSLMSLNLCIYGYFEVTMHEWKQMQESTHGLPWQEAPTEDVLQCFSVLHCFLLNRARLLTVEIRQELHTIRNIYFMLEDALMWSVVVATRIFTWRFGWLYLKSMWMGQTKRHWNRAWGRRAASTPSEKKIHRLAWPLLKSRRLCFYSNQIHQVWFVLRCVQRNLCME